MTDKNRFRNRLARRICNFALERIATPWYRDMVGGSIRYGLNAAARDHREERSAPEPWWGGLREDWEHPGVEKEDAA